MTFPAILFSALAALTPAASPLPAGAPTPPVIRDITPPMDVFPYPPWMVAVAGILALGLLALVIWGFIKWLNARPPPPQPTATMVALWDLQKLQARAGEMEPYAFSFAVSDVLRTFISKARFHLPATQQTSPEFLAAISSSPLFNENDRVLLGRFLERCDMIKFARMQASPADNKELVESALAFVQGDRA